MLLILPITLNMYKPSKATHAPSNASKLHHAPSTKSTSLLHTKQHLTIIRHRKARILGIRKRHAPRLRLTRNLEPKPEASLAHGTVDHKPRRRNGAALQRDGAKQHIARLAARCEDVELAGAGRRDGVARGEVGFELAAVGPGGDVVEGQGVGHGVEAAGVLVDGEVDGEADAAGVGDGAGAGGEGWGGGGEERGT